MYDTNKKFLEFVSDDFVQYVEKYRLESTFLVVAYCISAYGLVTPDMWNVIMGLLDRGVIKA